MRDLQRAYLDSLDVVRRLIASPEVEACWDQPSALQHYRTSGLAGHLVNCAAVWVLEGLAAPAPTQPAPVTATEYWVWGLRLPEWGDLQSPVHLNLRNAGERQTAGGYRTFLAEFDRVIRTLADRLETVPDDRLLSVLGGLIATRLDEFLRSRLIECVVHSDDLAVSAAIETPSLPALAVNVTVEELVKIARAYRGDLAVVRALSRRERDAADALHVL
jgi:hypothetical protein